MSNTKYTVDTNTLVITDGMLAGHWPAFRSLAVCEVPEFADFRLEVAGIHHAAVNIKVTGRKVRYDVTGLSGVPCMRVKVTYVGDGEPDYSVGGWAKATTLVKS